MLILSGGSGDIGDGGSVSISSGESHTAETRTISLSTTDGGTSGNVHLKKVCLMMTETAVQS